MLICHSEYRETGLDIRGGDCNDGGTATEQKEHYMWLKETLKKPADLKIVVGHVPIFSAGHHLDTKALVQDLLPLLQDNQVDMYLSGHDHTLQHLREKGEERSTDFIISGGGGYVADPELLPNENLVKGLLVNGFVWVEIARKRNGGPLTTHVDFVSLKKEDEAYSFERTYSV